MHMRVAFVFRLPAASMVGNGAHSGMAGVFAYNRQ